jgi:hypothetical protein
MTLIGLGFNRSTQSHRYDPDDSPDSAALSSLAIPAQALRRFLSINAYASSITHRKAYTSVLLTMHGYHQVAAVVERGTSPGWQQDHTGEIGDAVFVGAAPVPAGFSVG